jgi:HAD superfamily hydrolase (TIGR01549 family)
MIDTIIFDGEGVVVDTEIIWDRGQVEFLRRHGQVYDRDRIKPLITGRSVAEGVRIMQREYGFSGDVESQARERVEIVRQLFRDETGFITGFTEFFARIRGRYKTCIATAMDPELLQLVDQRLGLSALFAGQIFTLADVGQRAKPNPDLFLYAAARLATAPERCVVIEDAPHGLEAAKRAGMRCIALTTTYDRSRLTAADRVVDSYAAIDLEEFDRATTPARKPAE